MPPAVQALAYDADGNLTADGIWNYQFDGENRLVRMSTVASALPGGFPDRVLEFKYDYLGRRVQKRVLDGVTLLTERRFIYDGWNLIAELTVSPLSSDGSMVRSYTWGLDLTGSLTAAGGVAALLQITDHQSSISYLPAYDGNGNVAALSDAATGVTTAAYEYSPFGEPLRAAGAYAKENPFRFSTKFTDDETGLVHYNTRYYSATLGRFLNRDTISEQGGFNLYAYVTNNPSNTFDVLGRDTFGLGFEVQIGGALFGSASGQVTISYNANNPLDWRNWAVGYTGSFTNPSDGVGTPQIGLSIPVSFTALDRPELLNGTTFFVGASGGMPFNVGFETSNIDLEGALNGTNLEQFSTSDGSANYTVSLGLLGAPVPFDVHGGFQETGGASISAGEVVDAIVGAAQAVGTLLTGGSIAPPQPANPHRDSGVITRTGGTISSPFTSSLGIQSSGLIGSNATSGGSPVYGTVTLPSYNVTGSRVKPGEKGPPISRTSGGNSGAGQSSRSSIPGATVITDPAIIAEILAGLGGGSDAALEEQLRRLREENQQ